jgi:hypothetical protein
VTCDRSVVFPGSPVFSTNKTDYHDITEILMQVALNTVTIDPTTIRSRPRKASKKIVNGGKIDRSKIHNISH